MKIPVCTTIPARDFAMFKMNCYKKYGYGKGAIQKGAIDAFRDYNAKMFAKIPKEKQEPFLNEVRDVLRREIEKIQKKAK